METAIVHWRYNTSGIEKGNYSIVVRIASSCRLAMLLFFPIPSFPNFRVYKPGFHFNTRFPLQLILHDPGHVPEP